MRSCRIFSSMVRGQTYSPKKYQRMQVSEQERRHLDVRAREDRSLEFTRETMRMVQVARGHHDDVNV